MTRSAAALALMGAILAAPLANAQPAASPAPSPQLAAVAEGDALLAAAGADDLFVNLTGDGSEGIVLRHRASRLTCRLNPGSASNSIRVYDQLGPRGDDVGCGTGGPAGVRTLYAKRSTGRSLDEEFKAYLAEVRLLTPGLKSYRLTSKAAAGPITRLDQSFMPKTRIARFTKDGLYTSLWVAIVGGWVFEMRYSAPVAMAEFASGTAEPAIGVKAILEMLGVGGDAPVKRDTLARLD